MVIKYEHIVNINFHVYTEIEIKDVFARSIATQQFVLKEPLNKSVQDLSEDANKKCDFLFAHIFNDSLSMKMAVPPCTAGSSDLIRASLTEAWIVSFTGIVRQQLRAKISCHCRLN